MMRKSQWWRLLMWCSLVGMACASMSNLAMALELFPPTLLAFAVNVCGGAMCAYFAVVGFVEAMHAEHAEFHSAGSLESAANNL